MSLVGRSHRQRRHAPHDAPVAIPLRDVTDTEYEQMVDDEQERAYAALHEPHDDDRLPRGFLSPLGVSWR